MALRTMLPSNEQALARQVQGRVCAERCTPNMYQHSVPALRLRREIQAPVFSLSRMDVYAIGQLRQKSNY